MALIYRVWVCVCIFVVNMITSTQAYSDKLYLAYGQLSPQTKTCFSWDAIFEWVKFKTLLINIRHFLIPIHLRFIFFLFSHTHTYYDSTICIEQNETNLTNKSLCSLLWLLYLPISTLINCIVCVHVVATHKMPIFILLYVMLTFSLPHRFVVGVLFIFRPIELTRTFSDTFVIHRLIRWFSLPLLLLFLSISITISLFYLSIWLFQSVSFAFSRPSFVSWLFICRCIPIYINLYHNIFCVVVAVVVFIIRWRVVSLCALQTPHKTRFVTCNCWEQCTKRMYTILYRQYTHIHFGTLTHTLGPGVRHTNNLKMKMDGIRLQFCVYYHLLVLQAKHTAQCIQFPLVWSPSSSGQILFSVVVCYCYCGIMSEFNDKTSKYKTTKKKDITILVLFAIVDCSVRMLFKHLTSFPAKHHHLREYLLYFMYSCGGCTMWVYTDTSNTQTDLFQRNKFTRLFL